MDMKFGGQQPKRAAAALRAGSGGAVRFDEVMDALRMLDQQAAGYKPQPHYRKVLAQRVPGVFGRKDPQPGNNDRGSALG